MINLDNHHDGEDIEISYQILPEYHRGAYATEFLKAIISYSFRNLKIDKIIAETQISNTPSIKLLDKLGFSFEKTVNRFDEKQSIYSIKNNQTK